MADELTLEGDKPESKKRGRPPGSRSRKSPELVPANPGADSNPPGKRRAGGRPFTSKADQVAQWATLLNVANQGIALASPQDALAPHEIDLLANALQSDPWTGKLLRALPGAQHSGLFMAALMIGLPRLAGHGLLPASFAPTASVPMEAGGTYGDRGGNGYGENIVDFPPAGGPIVGDFTSDQGGPIE